MSLYVISYILHTLYLQQILYSAASKVADRDEVRKYDNVLPAQGYRTIQKALTNDNG